MGWTEDRSAIENLFDRLDAVARRAEPPEPNAQRLIGDKMSERPDAAYLMAQTILVQERALEDLHRRLDEEGAQADRPGPWQRQSTDQQRTTGGRSFLGGAVETALGVTGGVLLGSAIASLFTGGAAAEEATAEADAGGADSGTEDPGGGDDWGDFDLGGGF